MTPETTCPRCYVNEAHAKERGLYICPEHSAPPPAKCPACEKSLQRVPPNAIGDIYAPHDCSPQANVLDFAQAGCLAFINGIDYPNLVPWAATLESQARAYGDARAAEVEAKYAPLVVETKGRETPETHAADCAIAINARHGCTCAIGDTPLGREK